MSAWDFYTPFLEAVPDIPVRRALSHRAAFVQTDQGAGIAAIPEEHRGAETHERLVGASLRDVAQLVTSWDPVESALGTAAINSHLNTADLARRFPTSSIFTEAHHLTAGKRTVMIGHFRGQLACFGHADLTILERRPQPGDLPDQAAEYLLPDAQIVFITGMTFTNKTLPRLLELSANALTILVGPSAPYAPEAYRGLVDIVAPTVVTDPDSAYDLISGGASMRKLRPAFSQFIADLRPAGSQPPLSWQEGGVSVNHCEVSGRPG